MAKAWYFSVKNQIGVLKFDIPDSSVNILTTATLTELKASLDEIKTRTDLKALLITSGKDKIFIAGADINEIQGITTEADAYEKAEQGKAIFKVLEDLSIPTVTVINGACVGGGFELALSTSYRLASFADKVKIGLPEVNLGILPGFGGSIRMPKKMGLLKALPLILAGKIVSAKDALKSGMVDALFPEVTLEADAFNWIQAKLAGNKPRHKKKTSFVVNLLENNPLGRAFVLSQAKRDVLKKSKGFYPAPLKIIELISKTYGNASPKSFQLESRYLSKLAVTAVSKNLIRLFFLSEKYKKAAWTSVKTGDFKVKKCGIIGAGIMGGGIAQLVTSRNIPVRVKDVRAEALGGALREARQIYQGAVKRRKLTPSGLEMKMSLISAGLTTQGFKNCDMVIEAVVEDLGIKQKVFKEISEVVSEKTILVSNTSSLSVTQMAQEVKHPGRVVGLHFFNPVNRMPLVEVIRADQSSDDAVEKTIRFARELGKTVIVVKDRAGFLVNRLLLPYLNEAAYLMEEGYSPESIDRIALRFGMPMGPAELIDHVGIDVGYKVAKILYDAFGDRMKVAELFEGVKHQGLLGKKSGEGFYLYKGKGKAMNPKVEFGQRKKPVLSDEDALKRMIYVMINEAAYCLEEKVIQSAGDVDIGMIMGTGFPPFRGGLLRYADQIGISEIVETLKRFQNTVDVKRFQVSPYLQQLADSKRMFYGL